MAFTMTHLIVSEKIYKTFERYIDSLPQFYLGTIAPDAAHNRANYDSDFKKASHLVTGKERWGMTTDNDVWENNVISLLNKYMKSEIKDFVLGYCCHVLVDIYNNIHVWTPYRIKNAVDLEKGYNNIHHQENNKIDIELALTYEGRDDFWRNLAASRSIDLPNLVSADEIDKQKDYILNKWYKDKQRPDISANTIRTYEGEMSFIHDAAEYVAGVFHNCLEM